MKQLSLKTVCIFFAAVFTCAYSFAQPNVEQFKQVFDKQLQQLKPDGTSKRTVKFVSVVAGKSNGGYYRFNVTAYIHDYGAGYPANRYYGQTCVGKMDNWPFDMVMIEGAWKIQGRFTVSSPDRTCKDNPGAGVEATPLASVPGAAYEAGKNIAPAAVDPKAVSGLYLGQYASYGTGGTFLGGMGFTLLANKTYYDLDKKRGGTYVYDPQKATISFKGGFLSGQTGTNVKNTGFQLSSTIHCEPWR